MLFRSMKKELANTEQTIEALRARLAQPEPEPVAWRMHDGDMWCYLNHINHLHPSKFEPLYTAPPQREWQRLTDEEIEDAFMDNASCDDSVVFEYVVRLIEAKLREKNA